LAGAPAAGVVGSGGGGGAAAVFGMGVSVVWKIRAVVDSEEVSFSLAVVFSGGGDDVFFGESSVGVAVLVIFCQRAVANFSARSTISSLMGLSIASQPSTMMSRKLSPASRSSGTQFLDMQFRTAPRNWCFVARHMHFGFPPHFVLVTQLLTQAGNSNEEGVLSPVAVAWPVKTRRTSARPIMAMRMSPGRRAIFRGWLTGPFVVNECGEDLKDERVWCTLKLTRHTN